MRLVIFGPQGAGKGTQAARISEKYGVPVISTGEIFRWAIKGRTALGIKVLEYVEAGRLVPDDLTIDVVAERLDADDAADGFLLDGFPRSLFQAEALTDYLERRGAALDAALVINVPDEVAIRRLVGRRVCAKCGRNYNLEAPPAVDWKCDVCGGDVVERADDHDEATIRERLKNYHEQTEPLKDYYGRKGLLIEIDGTAPPDDVFGAIVTALPSDR